PPTEDAPARKAPLAAANGEDEEDEGSGPRLDASRYEPAARPAVPRAAVEDIVRVFSYDVDFQRRISQGDGLDVF
ncbi:hypothetical protein, partial [Serratia marcescens]|uniref:hypothetical protein n=1 Tax=Serratia marcescens TaxID=615 RepID=UPI00195382CF